MLFSKEMREGSDWGAKIAALEEERARGRSHSAGQERNKTKRMNP